jgi:hypothetical protein
MDASDFTAAELAVNSPEQRHSLMYACQRVIESAELACSASAGERRFDPRACERQIAEAVALESQLEQGRATVAVGLGIAGRVGASLAELIEAEMHERALGDDHAPAGTRVRRAAALMWTLVGLEAEIEREVLPAHAPQREQGRAPIEPTRA